MKSTGIILGLAAVIVLNACAKKDEAILSGVREDIRSDQAGDIPLAATDVAGVDTKLTLPAARVNAEWLQTIGSVSTRNEHPAFGAAPQLIWSVSIGAGDGRKTRITADPVVAGGRVFAMDAQSRVSAISTGGNLLWTAVLVPPNDSASEATGGGLAFGGGKLYVTTGFGLVTALDPETGTELWQQNMRATGSGSPSYRDGLVYVISGDEVAWALDADTGRIRWQLSATPDLNNVLGGPAPALSEKYAIFAFGAGELQGAFRKGGLRLWDAQVAGQRTGFSSARIGDITGDPVIVGDRIFTGSHSGRTVALGLGNGERLWTAHDGPLNRVWPAGNSIFMVTDRNELVRLSMEDGSRIWGTALSFFTKDKPKRQAKIVAHHGPVIAGGRLIVASNDGLIRFFDPVTGAKAGSIALPGGATTNPVVAGSTLYVVSSKGQLHAFR